MNHPFAPILDIMRRYDVSGDPAAFHAAVNVCFHRFESEVYDQIHDEMWQSLPQQVELLVRDSLRGGAPERIRMLDIGCGTGLAADSILRTEIASRIAQVDLLDTSPAMLARARERRERWGKPGQAIEGTIERLAGGQPYGLIVTCSVLHHVPDLPSFLHAVSGLQSAIPGALFLHLQDPNADSQHDPEREKRTAALTRHKVPDTIARFAPRRIVGRLRREMKGEQGQDYLSKTNRELIRTGVIRKPLRIDDLFAITDIHVHGGGISIETMKAWLPDYRLAGHRSYGFFGVLRSTLPRRLQAVEDECIQANHRNGEFVAAAWRRTAR